MTTETKDDGRTPSFSIAELGRVSAYDHPDHGWKWRACEVSWIEARIAAVAEEIARKHDSLVQWQNCAAAVLARFVNLGSRPNEYEWGQVAIEATRLINMPTNAK